jgi:hypothetical protein
MTLTEKANQRGIDNLKELSALCGGISTRRLETYEQENQDFVEIILLGASEKKRLRQLKNKLRFVQHESAHEVLQCVR